MHSQLALLICANVFSTLHLSNVGKVLSLMHSQLALLIVNALMKEPSIHNCEFANCECINERTFHSQLALLIVNVLMKEPCQR